MVADGKRYAKTIERTSKKIKWNDEKPHTYANRDATKVSTGGGATFPELREVLRDTYF